MGQSKTFLPVSSIDEQNHVNNRQKAAFEAMVAASDALSEQRQAAYLVRWREALVHVGRGAAVLDIGGGWPIDRVWDEVIGAHRVDYHLLDIDAAIVRSAQDRLSRRGLPSGNASVGVNTALPYPDGSFDAVFSSHCIEHSSDLPATLGEVFRVLRPGGTMIFAVPFGFDDSDEHLICMSAEDWIAATELAGFTVLTCHLGQTYVPAGDLFVVARREPQRPDAGALVTLAGRFSKAGRTFVPAADGMFRYSGSVIGSGGHRILDGASAGADIVPPRPVDGVLFLRHPWSGVVEVTAGVQRQVCDLHARIPYVHAVMLDRAAPEVRVRVLGRSRGLEQVVLHGALLAS